MSILAFNIKTASVSKEEHLAASKNGEISTKGDGLKTLISDHLGSILNSEIAKNMQYGVQGEILGKEPELKATTNPLIWGFAGYMYDPGSRKYSTIWRDYDQERGVWTSQDPVGLAGDDENFYRYVSNNSLAFVDPTGFIQWPCNFSIWAAY